MNIDEMKLYAIIGRQIKLQRSRLGITQQDLADSISMSRTSITNIEAGEQKVPLHTIYQLCLYLDLDVSELLPEISEVENKQKDENSSHLTPEDGMKPKTRKSVQDLLEDLKGD